MENNVGLSLQIFQSLEMIKTTKSNMQLKTEDFFLMTI